MTTYLLLVLIQIDTGRYDTKMAPLPSMEVCLKTLEDIHKAITPQPGISDWLSCIQARATTEKPA